MPRFLWSLLRQPPSIQEFGLPPNAPRSLEVRLELLNPVQQLRRFYLEAVATLLHYDVR